MTLQIGACERNRSHASCRALKLCTCKIVNKQLLQAASQVSKRALREKAHKSNTTRTKMHGRCTAAESQGVHDVMVEHSSDMRIFCRIRSIDEYIGKLTLKKQVSLVGNICETKERTMRIVHGKKDQRTISTMDCSCGFGPGSRMLSCKRYEPLSDGKRERAQANCRNLARSSSLNSLRICKLECKCLRIAAKWRR